MTCLYVLENCIVSLCRPVTAVCFCLLVSFNIASGLHFRGRYVLSV
jgi:hypothetical protein